MQFLDSGRCIKHIPQPASACNMIGSFRRDLMIVPPFPRELAVQTSLPAAQSQIRLLVLNAGQYVSMHGTSWEVPWSKWQPLAYEPCHHHSVECAIKFITQRRIMDRQKLLHLTDNRHRPFGHQPQSSSRLRLGGICKLACQSRDKHLTAYVFTRLDLPPSPPSHHP